jgi:hypothetical protein
LCSRAPRTSSAPFGLRLSSGSSILRLPERYWPVSEAGSLATSEVDQVVGGHHRALVVLDHDHRVAEVAQPVERRDQLLVVALVQADRGLVEHVHDADQAGADLGREADPLRLAA